MLTFAIKDLFKKWDDVGAMVLEWHPNQADVGRNRPNLWLRWPSGQGQCRFKFISGPGCCRTSTGSLGGSKENRVKFSFSGLRALGCPMDKPALVKLKDLWPVPHEFELSTAEDLPCYDCSGQVVVVANSGPALSSRGFDPRAIEDPLFREADTFKSVEGYESFR
ncbi:hypothetical protein TNCV_2376941 [Trichonephila clavipes]|nr:hypothetical protein TNCV_2376941 [Trichonephila clavipes]